MRPRPKTRLLQLLVMTLVTGGAVASIHFTRPPVTDSVVKRQWFWAHKTHETDDITIVVYGDSRVGQAIDSSAFPEHLPNHKAMNWGYPGAGFNPEMYGFIEDAMDGKQGAMVLLGITPYALSDEANSNQFFKEQWNRPADEVHRRLTQGRWKSFFEPVSPSQYRNADSKHGMYITYHAGGWEEAYELPENPNKWMHGYRNHFRRTQVSPANVEATFAFIQRMEAKGISVYGFRPSSSRQMEALEDEFSGFNEAEFIDGFEAAGGTWLHLDDRFAYYSYDGSHLHYNAAKRYSRDLAAVLSEEMNLQK